MTLLHDPFGPLLRIDRRDLAGLRWVKTRSRMWINGLKRRRRYGMPKGAMFTRTESDVIDALTSLEQSAGRLLALMEANQN